MLHWGRSGGDSVEVAGGGVWRAVSTSGQGIAGRFGSLLDPEARTQLRELITAATAEAFPAPDPEAPLPAEVPIETLTVEGVTVQREQGGQWPATWQALLTWTYDLFAAAPGYPLAALALDARGEGAVGQRGSEPLVTDGSGLAVRAWVAAPDGAAGKSWKTRIPSPEGSRLPVGWHVPLGLTTAELVAPPGGSIEVSVTVTLRDPQPTSITVAGSV